MRTLRDPRIYRHDPAEAGSLIQIRRASFEQLKKSATVITQQYNRFLPPVKQDDDGARAAIEALTAAVTLPEEEVREVFS